MGSWDKMLKDNTSNKIKKYSKTVKCSDKTE